MNEGPMVEPRGYTQDDMAVLSHILLLPLVILIPTKAEAHFTYTLDQISQPLII